MTGPSLFVRADTPEGGVEPALLAWAPWLSEVAARPELDSWQFARYRWQLLLRLRATPGWPADAMRNEVERSLAALARRGAVLGWRFEEHAPETERYGGAEGVAIAERLFMHDSRACLDLIETDANGGLGVSRREFSLLLTERLLDRLGFDRARRVAFYRLGHAWPFEDGTWGADDLPLLERRFRDERAALAALCRREPGDPEAWGGPGPARIAAAYLESAGVEGRRLADAWAAGRIAQDPVRFAWSVAHMHCVRLGIASTAEAILRFFMFRLHEEGDCGAA